jgi:hypothetical protein
MSRGEQQDQFSSEAAVERSIVGRPSFGEGLRFSDDKGAT